MELARNREDLAEQRRIVTEMESRFPQSTWLAEALFDTGNTFMLRREFATAVEYYSYLATHFPASKNASAAHWKAGWLSYRQGLYADAARTFDEQIRRYPTAKRRSRLSTGADASTRRRSQAGQGRGQLLERSFAPISTFSMRRWRVSGWPLWAMPSPRPSRNWMLSGAAGSAAQGELSRRQPASGQGAAAGQRGPERLHCAGDCRRSRFLLVERAGRGQIYTSYGENFRAMRALKRALPSAATASVKSIPLAYWQILFPEPWWDTIKAESAKNHLDPYLVASLIRQESEFDPAVSHANAYGLMQMLPSVGKQMAQEEGISHFETFQLLIRRPISGWEPGICARRWTNSEG